MRELAIKGWGFGIVIACVLMLPSPPTAQIGDWGWPAAGGVQLASLAGLIAFITLRDRAGFTALFLVTWALPLDLGVMQWLAGGWGAPYHELLLPALILGSAGLPPRRFVPFAAGVVVIALLPALYAPDAEQLLGMVTELTIWLFVATALAFVMARVRGQARLARSDPLTRVANRRALEEVFAGDRRQGGVVLAIGDLDCFKEVNDRHGHLAGDTCLSAVARALSDACRDGDRVYRWGGDEFAVLLRGTSPADAERTVARLEAAVRDAVTDPAGTPISITFGWASGGPDTSLESLTAAADERLLERKGSRVAAR